MDDLPTSIIEDLQKQLIVNKHVYQKNNLECKQLCDGHDFEYLGKGCTGIVAARHGLAYKFYYSFSLGTTEIPYMQKGEIIALKKAVNINGFAQYHRHGPGWTEMQRIKGLSANTYLTNNGFSFFKQKHVNKLFAAVKRACELNIVLDPNYPNLLYDKDKGFCFIDFSDYCKHLGDKSRRLLQQKDYAKFITRLLIRRNEQRAMEESLCLKISDLLQKYMRIDLDINPQLL